MTSAAFSAASGSDDRHLVSIRRRGAAGSNTATSTAADVALKQVIDARRRRHQLGEEPEQRPSLMGRVLDVPAQVVRDSIARLGLPQWAFRAVVLLAVAGVLFVAAAPGLFRKGPPVPVHPVTGRLLFGKTIPVGAQVTLHPRSGGLPDDAVPQGRVAEDGSVVFTTYAEAAGVPEGDYVATVQWYRVGRDGSVGGNAVPPRYASPHKSPLVVTVTPGANELPPFRITTK
jgi:hypothetical protein